jgi:outer membrane protein TolC
MKKLFIRRFVFIVSVLILLNVVDVTQNGGWVSLCSKSIAQEKDNPAKENNQDAKTTEKVKLSLAQCIRVTLDNNRQILMSREEKEKAKGRLKEATSLKYPHISGNLSYTRLDEVSKFDVGGMTIETGSLNNYKSEASINQLLYQGGRINASIKSAQIGETLADTQIANTEEEIILLATKSYYDVLLNQEVVSINKKSLENVSEHLRNVKLLNKEGVASNYDVLRSGVQMSNTKTLLIQSESVLRLSKLSLLRIMGAPIDDESSDMELTDKLAYTPKEIESVKALDTAFQMRKDIKQAKLMLDLQNKNITIAKSALRPSLSLAAGIGEEKPSRHSMGVIEWGDYWSASLLMSFPLFEGGQTRGKLAQEKATLSQYQIALRDTEEKTQYEIKQAVLSINDAAELIGSQQENVKQAEEGLRLAELGFKNGVNTQLEVMDAQVALDIARKNYLSAIYNYNLAQLMLEKAMGVLSNRK